MIISFNSIDSWFRVLIGIEVVFLCLSGVELYAECQVPNSNTKKCVSSDGSISCFNLSPENCGSSYKLRKKFPDGPSSSENGLTTEEDSDCYQFCECEIDPAQGGVCSFFCPELWFQADMTVVMPDGVCPPKS
jgi:hypothetical protein